ncbi:MAG: hypothetical protein LAP87_09120 [Acidobacteriia bacterium]|nr:hypothetical protein [Terriglobia bacterium]
MKKLHRALERDLDELLAAIRSGGAVAESLRQARGGIQKHYRAEEIFLEKLGMYDPRLATKISAQHAEVLEIAAGAEEAISAGQASDMVSLARRFQALAQHNIIEEERDVFPLADRCFTSAEQQKLERALSENA